MYAPDLVGETFGSLKVIKWLSGKERDQNDFAAALQCKCVCGKVFNIKAQNLISGNTKSCGCMKGFYLTKYRNEHPQLIKNKLTLYKETIPFKVLTKYKYDAKRRHITFNLNIEDLYIQWIKQNGKCALTGIGLYFEGMAGQYGNMITNASIDRIDSYKNYSSDNIQWTVKEINIMKFTHSQDFFIKLCKDVANYNT